MKALVIIAFIFSSALSFAHPNGTYMIDGDAQVTVTFAVEGRCPADVEGALRGSLRTLTFTEAAASEPYEFVTGYYVEIYSAGGGEVYVPTDESCIALEDVAGINATRSTFGGYSLVRVSL